MKKLAVDPRVFGSKGNAKAVRDAGGVVVKVDRRKGKVVDAAIPRDFRAKDVSPELRATLGEKITKKLHRQNIEAGVVADKKLPAPTPMAERPAVEKLAERPLAKLNKTWRKRGAWRRRSSHPMQTRGLK